MTGGELKTTCGVCRKRIDDGEKFCSWECSLKHERRACTRCGMIGHDASPPGIPAGYNCRVAIGQQKPGLFPDVKGAS